MRHIKLFETYFKDLTQYNYGGEYDRTKNDPRFARLFPYYSRCVNIGWLDESHDFEKGDVPEGFIDRINQKQKVAGRHMGWQKCQFCDDKKALSSSVYKIDAEEKSYFYPEMLEHYITKHKYLPPQEFIDVVMS